MKFIGFKPYQPEAVHMTLRRHVCTYVTFASESIAVMIKAWQRNRASVLQSR
jgi:hypothetical protein